MSESATAEAPVIPSQTVVPANPPSQQEQSAFDSVFGKDMQQAPERTETTPDASKAKGEPKSAKDALKAPEKPEKAEKPEAKKEAKAEQPKSRLDKLGELKAPEEPKEEPEVEAQSTDESPPQGKEAQSRWMQLKAAEKELNSIKPEFEKVRKQLEEITSKGHVPEEVQQKLERLEQRYAEEMLESDENFQREVLAPIHKSFTTIGDIAREANLDQTTAQALLNAVRDTSEVSRSRAIRKIIAAGNQGEEGGEQIPLSDEDVTTLSTLAINAANELHGKHWPKEVEYRQKAREIADAIKGKDAEVSEIDKRKQEETYGNEAKRIGAVLKTKMPLVFEKFPEAEEAILSARPSKEAADAVFDAQAGHLVHFMSQVLNEVLKENAAFKAREKSRDAARLKLDPNPTPPKQENQQPSFEEVFGTRR